MKVAADRCVMWFHESLKKSWISHYNYIRGDCQEQFCKRTNKIMRPAAYLLTGPIVCSYRVSIIFLLGLYYLLSDLYYLTARSIVSSYMAETCSAVHQKNMLFENCLKHKQRQQEADDVFVRNGYK